mgnify:CR=1 FL=1
MSGRSISDRFLLIAFEHFTKVGAKRVAPQVMFRAVIKLPCGQLGVRLYDSRDKLNDDIVDGLDVVDVGYYELKGVG